MIAIHKAKGGFDIRWIEYCEAKGIDYKIVNCYQNDIISQLSDCDALMWQFYQGSPKDVLMAKELMFSLEHAGFRVFPDFRSAWHFDDKVGQKYLLELIGAPLAPTWVFYEKADAIEWAKLSSFPKVFKLRGGSSSQNVRLAHTREEAMRLIRQAFGRGFPSYDPVGSLKERWRLFCSKKTPFRDLFEGLARFIIPPPYSKIKGRERGYIYFQEFIVSNSYDIRVVVIVDKAFAIKRMVRENDFRASGSGDILYERTFIDENTVKISFDIANKLQNQCVALDFVYEDSSPFLVEISYGFTPKGYDPCPGYWDKNLVWHEGKFDPYGWMVENLIASLDSKD
ncbi:MAG: hypothetical protein JXB49_06130 [Bacteroidales bacterium]|nr:hypothetical protein [Bacteroidales bacterium]